MSSIKKAVVIVISSAKRRGGVQCIPQCSALSDPI